MSQDELKEFIKELQVESHGLLIARNDACNVDDNDTVDLVDYARNSLDAAIIQLKRFYKRRQNF